MTSVGSAQARGETGTLLRYRRWMYAAAAYNAAWGAANALWPKRALRLLGAEEHDLLLWQLTAMLVGVYAPAYWWAARHPSAHAHIVAIGLLGKTLGPAGFAWSARTGRLPARFGWTILLNDVIWWPAFIGFVRAAAAESGGWRPFLEGVPAGSGAAAG